MCNAWKHVLGRRKNICAGPQHLIVLTGSFHFGIEFFFSFFFWHPRPWPRHINLFWKRENELACAFGVGGAHMIHARTQLQSLCSQSSFVCNSKTNWSWICLGKKCQTKAIDNQSAKCETGLGNCQTHNHNTKWALPPNRLDFFACHDRPTVGGFLREQTGNEPRQRDRTKWSGAARNESWISSQDE